MYVCRSECLKIKDAYFMLHFDDEDHRDTVCCSATCMERDQEKDMCIYDDQSLGLGKEVKG